VSLTLDGGECLASRLGVFTPAPIGYAGWTSEPFWMTLREKYFSPARNRKSVPRSLDTSHGHYTDSYMYRHPNFTEKAKISQ